MFAEDPAPNTNETSDSEENKPEGIRSTDEQNKAIKAIIERRLKQARKSASEKAQREANEKLEAERLKNMSESERQMETMKSMQA